MASNEEALQALQALTQKQDAQQQILNEIVNKLNSMTVPKKTTISDPPVTSTSVFASPMDTTDRSSRRDEETARSQGVPDADYDYIREYLTTSSDKSQWLSKRDKHEVAFILDMWESAHTMAPKSLNSLKVRTVLLYQVALRGWATAVKSIPEAHERAAGLEPTLTVSQPPTIIHNHYHKQQATTFSQAVASQRHRSKSRPKYQPKGRPYRGT